MLATLAVLGFTGPLRVAHMPSAHAAASSSAAAPVVMYGAFAKQGKKINEDGVESFVATEMRGAAMALHTKQQAPKEGKAEAKEIQQTPVQTWQPGRPEYLQFLVDSRHVYQTLEELVDGEETFATFRESGLERSEALTRDIAWFGEQDVPEPAVAPQGASYAKMLREMVDKGELEAFVCHFCACRRAPPRRARAACAPCPRPLPPSPSLAARRARAGMRVSAHRR